MAVAANQTLNVVDATDASTYAFASYTPSASGLLVLFPFIHAQNAVGIADGTSITGTSISGAAVIASRTFNTGASGNRKVEIWAALSTGSAGVVTISLPGSPIGCVGSLVEITGADTTVGTSGVVQSTTNFSDSNTTALTVTLGAFSNVNNGALVVFGTNQAVTVTPKAGWSELSDSNIAAPNLTREVQFIATNDTAVQGTASSIGLFGAVAVEIANLAGYVRPAVYRPVTAVHRAANW